MALTVAVSHELGVYKVKMGGELDTETAELFSQKMAEEVLKDRELRAVQLHLQELKYISSMGLGAIAQLRKEVTARRGVLVTVGAQPQVARVFEIVKMLPKEVVFINHAEADEYLKAVQRKIIEEKEL